MYLEGMVEMMLKGEGRKNEDAGGKHRWTPKLALPAREHILEYLITYPLCNE